MSRVLGQSFEPGYVRESTCEKELAKGVIEPRVQFNDKDL